MYNKYNRAKNLDVDKWLSINESMLADHNKNLLSFQAIELDKIPDDSILV